MIEKSNFEQLKKNIELFYDKREKLIKDARTIVRLSKLVIYSVHRNELKEAEKLAGKLKEEFSALDNSLKKYPELKYSAPFKIAGQEFTEAISFLVFIKENRLVTKDELGVDSDSYLLGLFDLTGELARKAVNSAIANDVKTAIGIKNFVSDIYGELLKFDFANGPIRKGFDGVKYNLKKLEDLAYDLRMRGFA